MVVIAWTIVIAHVWRVLSGLRGAPEPRKTIFGGVIVFATEGTDEFGARIFLFLKTRKFIVACFPTIAADWL